MPEILLHMVKWEWYYNDSRLEKGQIFDFSQPCVVLQFVLHHF